MSVRTFILDNSLAAFLASLVQNRTVENDTADDASNKVSVIRVILRVVVDNISIVLRKFFDKTNANRSNKLTYSVKSK